LSSSRISDAYTNSACQRLLHTATHCTTLHAATLCNTQQTTPKIRLVLKGGTLQHTAIRTRPSCAKSWTAMAVCVQDCSTLQHAANSTNNTTSSLRRWWADLMHPQHTATHCNTPARTLGLQWLFARQAAVAHISCWVDSTYRLPFAPLAPRFVAYNVAFGCRYIYRCACIYTYIYTYLYICIHV